MLGKYSAIKGFFLGLIILIVIADLIFVGTHDSNAVDWINAVFTMGFGLVSVKYLWDKWKEK